ncbi:type II toxin-antitoxin system PemK/MazF family toxin [Atlantibacter subterraneus]|uniref:type II toxin-antitoxin system PemK/MazF family toxin n=1 Tax=Atlantibacter subterraneus TaxID=255519 RepID=UPI0020C20E11|nr:type II toxin-antitoxin system PemK/MazF family toxin [Atlantibacter subterranea]UTJ46157.1 type II toxin-antitoxin system PemK/MazF family toxin [Atlantibacter subterranea]
MGLKFQPAVRSVLICDFAGMVIPEIVKKRPVIIIARNRHNHQLVTVVPVSTTEPIPKRNYHHELNRNPIPGNEHIPCWVKCDMIMTVSIARLDRIKNKTWDGRSYIVPEIPEDEFELIRTAVLFGIGMPIPNTMVVKPINID